MSLGLNKKKWVAKWLDLVPGELMLMLRSLPRGDNTPVRGSEQKEGMALVCAWVCMDGRHSVGLHAEAVGLDGMPT